MEKKNFFTELREDKKKRLIVIGIPVVLICVIAAGFIFGGKDPAAEKQTVTADPLIVPIDTISGKKQKGKSELYSNDFFEEEQQDDGFQENNNSAPDQAPSHSSYRPISYGSSGGGNNVTVKKKTNSVSSVPVVPETPEPASKRRRAPTDELGNMGGSSGKAMYSAVVANNNKIVKSGSYVSIRVAEDITIDGMKIPRNSIISGIASYSGERMNIDIKSVKVGSTTKTVKWMVVDEDGNDGVAIPQSVLNDIARDGSDDVIEEGSKVEGNVPGLGGVKINIKKKNKEVSFVINNGHRIYIKEKKS